MIVSRSSFVLVTAAALFLVVVVAAAQSPAVGPDPKKVKNPVAASAASVTAGAATYKKYCAFCHGPEAKGNGPLAPKGSMPPDLTDAKWDHGDTDGEIFHIMQNGVGGTSVMKGFKGKMPDQDMWNVVNYLRSLGATKKTS
jgi:mono/diheme cytochrome c family protein